MKQLLLQICNNEIRSLKIRKWHLCTLGFQKYESVSDHIKPKKYIIIQHKSMIKTMQKAPNKAD